MIPRVKMMWIHKFEKQIVDRLMNISEISLNEMVIFKILRIVDNF